MTMVFFSIALAVGALCGALMGYETRDLKRQPGGWRPWLLLALVAIAVVSGAVAVEQINATVTVSTLAKGLSAAAAALAFVVALIAVRKSRR